MTIETWTMLPYIARHWSSQFKVRRMVARGRDGTHGTIGKKATGSISTWYRNSMTKRQNLKWRSLRMMQQRARKTTTTNTRENPTTSSQKMALHSQWVTKIQDDHSSTRRVTRRDFARKPTWWSASKVSGVPSTSLMTIWSNSRRASKIAGKQQNGTTIICRKRTAVRSFRTISTSRSSLSELILCKTSAELIRNT